MPRTASSPKKAASSGAPNLLVALADQLRPHSTSLQPAAPLRTPNLERLAAEGVNFVNAISNTPLCGPFRACTVTGRYPHANGVIANWQRLPENQPTLGHNGPQPPGAFLASYAGYEDFHLGWEYRGVRTKRYTYARSLFELLRDYAPQPGRAYSRTPEVFLFDNLEDPYQQHNLAGDPTHAAILAGLEALLDRHLRATGDSFRPATDYAPCYRRGRRIRPLP